MSANSTAGVLSFVWRYKKGLALGGGTMFVHLAIVATLLHRGVPVLSPSVSSGLIDAGVGSRTAELAAPILIHVGAGVILIPFYTGAVRARFYSRSRDGGLFPIPYYSWAMDFVEERQLGGSGAEEWAETPPPWSDIAAALGIGVFVLTFGLLATGAPLVGLGLATGMYALGRRAGLRPLRPLSWHLALSTLLGVVATVFLSALLYIDAVDEWFQTVVSLFMGPITDRWLLLVSFPLYLLSLIGVHVVVTYVGVYYLLVAADGVRVRAGLVPTTERAAEPAEESAGRTGDDGGAVDSSERGDGQYSAGESGTDASSNESRHDDGHATTAVLGSVAAFVLLLAVVLPLAEDTVVGAASVMLFSGFLVAMVVIYVGFPAESVVGGVFAGVVLAAIGGLAVHAASLLGATSGAERTALLAMAIWVGALVGPLGWAAIVANRSASR